jgi:hypothetical protein
MSFFMQNKLGELSNQRYMDVISEQDRLMRERAAEEDVYNQKGEQRRKFLNISEAYEKSFIEATKDPTYTFHVKGARLAELQGDRDLAKQHYGAAFQVATPLLESTTNVLKGQVGPEDYAAWINAMGTEGLQKMMSEAGTAGRAAKTVGLEEKRQGIDIERLGLEKSKHGLERQKFAAETGGGALGGETPLKTSDYYKAWHSKIEGVKKYLVAMKEGFDDTGTIDASIDLKQLQKLWGGTSIPEILGRALTKLNTLDTKAYRSPLSAQDESWIDRSQDITGLKQEFEGEAMGGLVAERPDAETVKRMEGVESTAVNPPAVAVAPPPVKSPYEGTRKHVRETATGQEYWIVLRNGQWIRE